MPPARRLAGSLPPTGYLHCRSITLPTVNRVTARLLSSPSSLPISGYWTCWWRAAAAEAAGVSLPPSPAPASLPCPRKGECSDCHCHFAPTVAGGGRGAQGRPRGVRASSEGGGSGSTQGGGLPAVGQVPARPARDKGAERLASARRLLRAAVLT